jgi:hypothetical protein
MRARLAPLTALVALAAVLAAACGGGAGSAPPAKAWVDPGSVVQGEWTLYYNALPSADLPAAVARAYGIEPRPRRALVTVSLTRAGDPRAAAGAEVEVAARSLLGQPRPVALRRVERDGVVSWLGEFDAGEREQLVFTVRARVPGVAAPLAAEFRREFQGGG